MQTLFRGKHFITLQDWTKEEIDTLLDVSYDLKRKFAMGKKTPYLEYKTVFLMFLNSPPGQETPWRPGLHSWEAMATTWIPAVCKLLTENQPKIQLSFFPASATELQ